MLNLLNEWFVKHVKLTDKSKYIENVRKRKCKKIDNGDHDDNEDDVGLSSGDAGDSVDGDADVGAGACAGDGSEEDVSDTDDGDTEGDGDDFDDDKGVDGDENVGIGGCFECLCLRTYGLSVDGRGGGDGGM